MSCRATPSCCEAAAAACSSAIPAFDEYIPRDIVSSLLEEYSVPISEIPGLRVVGGIPDKFAELISVDALRFVVDAYRASLSFDHTLQQVLSHRKLKRRELDQAARSGRRMSDIVLSDGTEVLGFREDTRWIREDPSWRVTDRPKYFEKFHDTITGPPTASIVVNALTSGVSFFMVDFEDSSACTLSTLLDGLTAVTRANQRAINDTVGTKTYKLLPDTPEVGVMIVRPEGLHLPNGHFLVDGSVMPAHLLTIGLYLYHNWEPMKENGEVPSFYLPKLETFEEALYMAQLFRTLETNLSDLVGADKYQPGTLRCFSIIENAFSVFQKEEILYALRDYIVGLNGGWHDYVASIGAVHAECNSFAMPPKSNLRIVIDYLEAYQMGMVEVCRRRHAIPIGGMNAMVPPANPVDLQKVEGKIVEAFSADFWMQVSRGLEGVWLAHKELARTVKGLKDERLAHPPKMLPMPEFTTEKILVSDTSPVVASEEEVERNLADALQYLAAYLTGTGAVGLTATMKDGTKVRLMEDAATLERSRRELWYYNHHRRPIRLRNGDEKAVDEEYLRAAMYRVMQRIRQGDADVPFNGFTKNAYDIAYRIVEDLVFNPHPVDYFTVLAVRYLLEPFRKNPAKVEKLVNSQTFPFLRLPNLCPRGRVVAVSDESFHSAKHLLHESFPPFTPHSFKRGLGQMYRGWETKRHNLFPPDFAVIRLHGGSLLKGVNIDTAHFDGNHGQAASLEGVVLRAGKPLWIPLLNASPLMGNSRNFFPLECKEIVYLVKLNNYPDGGISLLELYGEELPGGADPVQVESALGPFAGTNLADRTPEVVEAKRRKWIEDRARIPCGLPRDYSPSMFESEIYHPDVCAANPKADPSAFVSELGQGLRGSVCQGKVNMCALESGSKVLGASSSHYSSPALTLKPGRGMNMGDGWETRRMRTPVAKVTQLDGPVDEFNWYIVQLGIPGKATHVVLDTLHNVFNAPVAASVESTYCPTLSAENFWHPGICTWKTLIPPSQTFPQDEQCLATQHQEEITHVLVKILPCGGLGRLRIMGTPSSSSPSLRAKM